MVLRSDQIINILYIYIYIILNIGNKFVIYYYYY